MNANTKSTDRVAAIESVKAAAERVEAAMTEFREALDEATVALGAGPSSAVGEAAELAEDIAAYDAAKAEDDGNALPHAVVVRLAAGENPIKVFRQWRGLTQAELARSLNSSAAYISQLETGARSPGNKILFKLADALDMEFTTLFDWRFGLKSE